MCILPFSGHTVVNVWFALRSQVWALGETSSSLLVLEQSCEFFSSLKYQGKTKTKQSNKQQQQNQKPKQRKSVSSLAGEDWTGVYRVRWICVSDTVNDKLYITFCYFPDFVNGAITPSHTSLYCQSHTANKHQIRKGYNPSSSNWAAYTFKETTSSFPSTGQVCCLSCVPPFYVLPSHSGLAQELLYRIMNSEGQEGS